MKRYLLFLPVAALTVLAGYVGYRMGQPVSETDIITHFAQVYVAETGEGAKMTDCLATVDPREDIRLVVICSHPGGQVYRYPVGPRGQLRQDLQQEGSV